MADLVSPLPLVLVSAVALFDAKGRILLSKRPAHKAHGGLWELPGGKIDVGETPEAALVRELSEELGIKVAAHALTPLTFASHSYAKFHLLMPVYACRAWAGELHGREGQELAWVCPRDLPAYPMPEADLPLIPVLQGVEG